ncbi:MAG: AHH domain-containing protein [Polyangiaceae bacterium]|nr:AHH domain-containing protein [Polyangiaceae bacterium]
MGKKKHTPDEGDWKFKRKWDGSHLTNVNSASPKGYLRAGYRQVHHILCFSGVQDAHIKVTQEEKEYIHKCMKVTDWDINAAANAIGLPLKLAYYERPRDTSKWNLPCHQVDHNPHYTGNVIDKINADVWPNVVAQQENCESEGKDIASFLNKIVKHYKDFLIARGILHGGTKVCWETRLDPANENTWYIPFSMHPTSPPKRSPPPEFAKLPADLKSRVSEFFKHVK